MSELMDRAVIGMPFDMAMQNHLSRMQFYNRAQAILAERDALLDRGLRLPVDPQAAEPLIEDIVSRVSEWDDRTSPEDWPEALLITANELREELRELARGLRLPGDGALQQLADRVPDQGDVLEAQSGEHRRDGWRAAATGCWSRP